MGEIKVSGTIQISKRNGVLKRRRRRKRRRRGVQ
jgi:hypothetical protein